MGRRRKERDQRYNGAATLWVECNRKLTIAEAMLVRGFSKSESDNKSFQKTVLREAKRLNRLNEPLITSTAAPPPTIITDDTKSILSLSDAATIAAVAVAAEIRPTVISRDRPDQVAVKRANWMIERERYAAAFMLATRQYAEEKSKPKSTRKSAREVILSVTRGFIKVHPPLKERTIQLYVQKGKIGTPPSWPGPRPAELPSNIFSILVKAFDSYLQILQFNEDTTGRQFAQLLKQVQLVLSPLKRPGISTIYQLLRHTKIDFCLKQASVIEERRSAWSTYENLEMWFNNWKGFLEEKGFGKTIRTGDDERFEIPDDQLARIINIDESCLSLNGSTQRRGGRPSQIVSDRRMQLGCLRTSKSSVTVTIICGSSAAGEAIPPHFQFTSKAEGENIRIKTEIVEHLPKFIATFGNCGPTTFYPTVAGNKKGGMDNKAFEIYVNKNIRLLYPDVCDVPGKRLLVKIDGGPGRLNHNLLASLAADGIYLYPSLCNNTHISQETDQSYGFFKSIFTQNLHKLHDDRLRHSKPTSFPWTIVGLLCFGGTNRETGEAYRSAHGEAFSKEKNRWAWKKVGAAPLTRACLNDPRIRHASLSDPKHVLYRRVEEANRNACELLDRFHLKGKHLKVKLKIRKEVEVVDTPADSLARAKVLLEAKSHGQRYIVSKGGCAFNCKDMMVAMELGNRRAIVLEMEKDKKKRLNYSAVEAKALKFLEEEQPIDKYKKENLDLLLEWKGIIFTDETRKTKAKSLKIKEKREFWLSVKNNPSRSLSKWSAADESKLQGLKDESKELSIDDTAVGRFKNQKILKLLDEYGLDALLEKTRDLYAAKERGEISSSGLPVIPVPAVSVDGTEISADDTPEEELLQRLEEEGTAVDSSTLGPDM